MTSEQFGPALFTRVLVANRGEIAVRIIRTLRRLGIGSVAVYSDADTRARHVSEADEAIRIGPAAAAESYLNIESIVRAAAQTGAEAIHPGYGFLSENAAFARACAGRGLVFIGPPATAIDAMGDKIAAKARVAAAGVPVVPGAGAPGMSDAGLIEALGGFRYPLLIKPSAGGGGKGMHLVEAADALPRALQAARREARAAFGDDTLLVERFIERPRHIEIQVLADTAGATLHLGERECSLQRRHQKIIEEAPSPLLDPARREAMGAAAVDAARSVGYTGAGTVEFIVSGADPDEFFFMEMNTRLQVEHPVTELVTGLDLVEWQVRVAAGQPLPFGQAEVRLDGHAMEARVYAEDPARGFLPTGGTVLAAREPTGPGVRVDSGLSAGTEVGSAYDPMLAKVIAWGPDRVTARHRLDRALAGTVLLGVTTNVEFLRALLADPDVAAGRLDTGLAERLDFAPAGPPDEVLAAAALERLLAAEPAGPVTDPWDVPDGWRVGEPAWTRLQVEHGPGATAEVRVRGLASAGAEVMIGDEGPVPAQARADAGALTVTFDGKMRTYVAARTPGADGGTLWLSHAGRTWALTARRPVAAQAGAGAAAGLADGVVRAPMPGTVVAALAETGQQVSAGQPLVIVEAMKMEHTVTAPAGGVVAELTVKPGQPVRMDETLAVIRPEE
ncbi:MAG TPA: biotin carboxylase N-terminal domain-containing protein [Streptosporangiaceae bacterium]|jgi:acetyl-CoA/propionyl-CoA carboxylase biotin carboxyl carrier protein